jgi:hypothetical protein
MSREHRRKMQREKEPLAQKARALHPAQLSHNPKTAKATELGIDSCLAVILALAPFGYQMLGFPSSQLVGVVSWLVCLFFVYRICWILTDGRFSTCKRYFIAGIPTLFVAFVLAVPVRRKAQVLNLEAQQAEVYQNLKFSVELPPHVHPRLSMFSVSNWGHTNIGKHEISCEMNLLVLEYNTVGNSAGMAKFSDAELAASGGTQSDPCLAQPEFPQESAPLCFDVTVNFSYALETQPSVQKLKSTRFVGFMHGDIFAWSEEPVGQQESYCMAALQARDERRRKNSNK